ncbi:MAG: NAD-dependent epimerase/dehydratase family protein [Flavobacteriales bacterium]|nr:NAD-dependent epimerase/dehydratase family protein [Flavobacteriales bacterium]
MQPDSKIYVAGHNGMVGSSMVRLLGKSGFTNIIARSSSELDLRNQVLVNEFFENEKPEFVFLAAAKVGGILANDTYRADFIYDNLMIEANVIHAAYQYQVKKLLFLGSSCIYPKMADQPIKEEYLLSGALEPTNEPYAIAKIAGIKLCENYRKQYGCNFVSAMPTNLYGVGDNYHPQNSHVLPALIRKFHLAKENGDATVELWGSGTPKREFLYIDDLASACLFMMQNYNEAAFLNVGVGEDISIAELAETIKGIIGFEGEIKWNTEMPDGTPRKLLDVSKLAAMGWKPTIGLDEGIKLAYADFLNRKDQLNG